MPSFNSKVQLTSTAASSNIVLADIERIKGAFKVYTSADLASTNIAYFSDGQIFYLEDSGSLYKANVTLADYIEVLEDTVTFEPFSFDSGSFVSASFDGVNTLTLFGQDLEGSERVSQSIDLSPLTGSAESGASVTVSDTAPESPSEGDLWWKSNDGSLYVYYDGFWVISVDTSTNLPSGTISGSSQVVFSDIGGLPSGLVSSSEQVDYLQWDVARQINGSGPWTKVIIDGPGLEQGSHGMTGLPGEAEPDLYLQRGKKYRFRRTGQNDTFRIYEEAALTTEYTTGVTNAAPDRYDYMEFEVHYSAPRTLYLGMRGVVYNYSVLHILDEIPQGTISGSDQLTSSYDSRYELQGRGIVSGSDQVTSSLDTRYILSSSYLTDSASFDTRIENVTSTGGADWDTTLLNIPSGILSSSTQVVDSLPSGVLSGSDQLTSSYDERYILSGSITDTNWESIEGKPSGLVSSSDQLTSSYDSRYVVDTGIGIITGSQQISDLGFVSGSFSSSVDSDSARLTFGDDISSFRLRNVGSAESIVFSSLEYGGDPTIGIKLGGGIVSSSQQVEDAISSSYYPITGGYLSGSITLGENNGDGLIWSRYFSVGPDGNPGTRQGWIKTYISSYSDANSRMEFQEAATGKFLFTFAGNYLYPRTMEYSYTNGLTIQRGGISTPSGSDTDWYTGFRERIISASFNSDTGDIKLHQPNNAFITIDGLDSRYIRQVTLDNLSQSLDDSITNVSQSLATSLDERASQTLDFNSVNNVLTILDGNSVDLSSLAGGGGGGGGSSIWSTGSDFYYVDADLQVTGSFRLDGSITASDGIIATTLSGALDYSDLVNVPSLLSSSTQVVDSLPSGVVSGSSQIQFSGLGGIPSGFISSSDQVLGGTGIVSSSQQVQAFGVPTSSDAYTGSYDIRYALSSSVATQFSDFDARIDSVESTGVPLGTVSSSAQTIANLPTGTASGSEQFTASYDSRYLNVLGDNVVSSSQQVIGHLPRGVVSGSIQVLGGSGIVSSSQQIGKYITSLGGVTSSDGYTASYDTRYLTQENFGIESSSFDSRIQAIVDAGTPPGTVSSSAQTIENLGGSGIISGSSQVTYSDISSIPSGILSSSGQVVLNNADFTGFDTTDIDEGTNLYYTDERVKDKMDTDGVISSSQQVVDYLPINTFSGSFTGLGGTSVITEDGNIFVSSSRFLFNGNRAISQDLFPQMKSSSFTPGTSGSILEFLEAVFYPNVPPTITSGNGTINEFETTGTLIGSVTATDPQGQVITFGTSSTYTDDYVRVASNGGITLNTLATSASFNTDLVSAGVHGHSVIVTATDTFNSGSEKEIFIIVTPNSAPVFRESSTSGNVITQASSFVSESAENGTLVKTIYFTDVDTDDITIQVGDIVDEAFNVSVSSDSLTISVNTSSLNSDYLDLYTFDITASDAHYQEGNDLNAITYLPVSISLQDNAIPTINDQILGDINERSANGASVGSISADDVEGDTINFSNFVLHQLQLDGSEVSIGTYAGTSQLTDPHENPFSMASTGEVTRRAGRYLNSDLIDRYIYSASVSDQYNSVSNPALITIDILDDTPATLFNNWSAGPYIKESELSGTTIKIINYGSTAADYNVIQSGNFTSSNPAIAINSFGNLSLNVDLSGSTTQSGDTIDTIITFTNDFGTTTTDSITIQVVGNEAPTITFTDQSDNFNTNMATSGTTMVSMSVSDTEDDVPYSASIGGTNASDFTLVYSNTDSSSIGLHANSNLVAGTYTYDISVTDTYSKTTTYSGRTLTVAQADDGTMSTNGTLYVIESAVGGDNIVLGTNGFTGTQGRVSVTYSPDYGTQAVSTFASSNALIDIDSDGYLTVGNDISGSGTLSGNTITSTITFTDQYGNSDSDTISVSVRQNNAPTATNTTVTNNNTNQATGSERILRLTLTDSEGDSIPNSGLSFSGYNTTYFTPSISTPNMELNVNSTSVPAGTYSYTANIQDEHGFRTNTVNNTFTINQADTGTLGGDTAIYIIESAESGEVFRDQTGYNAGNAAQVTVSYSPDYGSASPQSFTSSNPAISVDNSGNLTLGVNISGSITQSGATFTSDITFTDEYGNVGSGSVTATVFGNSSPVASFTQTTNYGNEDAIGGSNAGSVTITDTEGNSPFTITVGGTDGGKFTATSGTSPLYIQPTGSLSVGTYTIDITVTDNYGETVTLTGETITVEQSADYGKTFIYTSTRTGGGTLSDGNYDGLMGITSENTSTDPDLITGYQSIGPSPIFELKDGHLGDSSITVGGGTLTKRAEVSGSNLDTIISSSFSGDGTTADQILIIFPSGSDMGGTPTSMTDTLGGSTVGEYVLYVKAAGESSFTVGGTQIHMFDVDSAVEGYTRWNIIGRNTVNTAASYEIRLIPSSGSAP
jgi:hypothetical protein